mmetsp:Transcript_26810/g.62612  ORF Transcript_26810/g.62612 Transcript_26810/m.62612 type:complete len:231 (-) Transcript_26810:758-1450(-)
MSRNHSATSTRGLRKLLEPECARCLLSSSTMQSGRGGGSSSAGGVSAPHACWKLRKSTSSDDHDVDERERSAVGGCALISILASSSSRGQLCSVSASMSQGDSAAVATVALRSGQMVRSDVMRWRPLSAIVHSRRSSACSLSTKAPGSSSHSCSSCSRQSTSPSSGEGSALANGNMVVSIVNKQTPHDHASLLRSQPIISLIVDYHRLSDSQRRPKCSPKRAQSVAQIVV